VIITGVTRHQCQLFVSEGRGVLTDNIESSSEDDSDNDDDDDDDDDDVNYDNDYANDDVIIHLGSKTC